MHINDILDHPNLQAIADRFHTMYDRAGPDECWVWKRARSHNGYGLFTPWHHQQVRAHRLAYVLAHGAMPRKPAFEGDMRYSLQMRHRCHNPLCVNPKHLVPGTAKENAKDKRDAARWYGRGEDNMWAILTDADIVAIRQDPRRQIDIAKDYGVARAVISKVILRQAWRHVKGATIKRPKHLTGGKGTKNGRAKLTEAQIPDIRKDRRHLPIIAAEYGVSIATIQLARAGKTWKHVT